MTRFGWIVVGLLLVGPATVPATTGAADPAADLGRIALVGDSITQGGATPSYRYVFWKALVDAGLEHGRDYTFVGSQTGFYAGGKQAAAPDHGGQAFPNVHEGHWGWRSAWLAGAAPLPKGRHGAKNLGAGTVATWTGRSKAYATADKGEVPYAGPVATPDTVVLMIGINDLADGTPAAEVAGHVRTIVGLYQAANPAVRVHVCSVLPVGAKHAKAVAINPQVKMLDELLARQSRGWSTTTSRVDFVDLRPGFDATTMTYDNTHPNEQGEAVIAGNLAKALGIGGAQDDARPPARRPAKAASFKPPAGDAVDVYVLTGQSNMLGTTAAGDQQPDPGADPADAATRIFWSNVSSSNDAWPPRLHGDSGGALVPLAVQQGDGGKNATFWGPEFGLARALAARGHRRVAIIKACRGGGGNALWDKATFDRDPAAGHMWGHLRDTLEAAIDALAADGRPAIHVRGLGYLQGESNSDAEAQAAAERLDALVRNLTALVEKKAPGATRGMRVAVAEIAASRANPRRAATTAAQRAWCVRARNAAFVPTADLALKSDGIHFGGAEKLEIGRRLAAALDGPRR